MNKITEQKIANALTNVVAGAIILYFFLVMGVKFISYLDWLKANPVL